VKNAEFSTSTPAATSTNAAAVKAGDPHQIPDDAGAANLRIIRRIAAKYSIKLEEKR
jgi:hypothetical protein